MPGPLIKWFLKGLGLEGMVDIAQKMKQSGALVETILGYPKASDEIHYFTGSLRGNIVPPRGRAFGFDPIFEVENTSKTFAEMNKEEKNAISHRYQAFSKLKDFLQITNQ